MKELSPIRITDKSVYFEDMCWTRFNQSYSDLVYMLSHGNPTKSELLQAAGILCQYRHLVYLPKKLRDHRIRHIRAAEKL